jgi:hypothetical protein
MFPDSIRVFSVFRSWDPSIQQPVILAFFLAVTPDPDLKPNLNVSSTVNAQKAEVSFAKNRGSGHGKTGCSDTGA